MKKRHPTPHWAEQLLRWRLSKELFEEVQGDLNELYEQWAEEMSPRKAYWLYVWNALAFLRPLPKPPDRSPGYSNSTDYCQPFFLHPPVLANYFRIAWRNLIRNKGFSAINLLGLSIGMVSALLILLWVRHEVSYERFHQNKNSLYEVWNRAPFNGKLESWNTTPMVLGPTLQQHYPEVAGITRTYSRWYVTTVGEKQISSKALIADPSFLYLFSFPLLQGNPSTALTDVSSIVLTQQMAVKMFGSQQAMGKVIKIDRDNFTVTGILQDLPTITDFDFEYIL